MLYRKLGKSIWQGVETSKKAKASKGFDRYLDYFFERLKLLKRDAECIEVFNKTMSGAAAERAHSDRGEYDTEQPKKFPYNRSGRSNHLSTIDEEYDEEYEHSAEEDDDDDADYDGVIDFDLEDYESRRVFEEDRKLTPEEKDLEERSLADGDREEDTGVVDESQGIRADGTLLTIQEKRALTDEEKSYNTGKCDLPGCKFSHERALATKKLKEDMARLNASPHNPDRVTTPVKKPPGPRVSWPDDAVRQSTNPRLSSSGGRGGGRGTPTRILKRG